MRNIDVDNSFRMLGLTKTPSTKQQTKIVRTCRKCMSLRIDAKFNQPIRHTIHSFLRRSKSICDFLGRPVLSYHPQTISSTLSQISPILPQIDSSLLTEVRRVWVRHIENVLLCLMQVTLHEANPHGQDLGGVCAVSPRPLMGSSVALFVEHKIALCIFSWCSRAGQEACDCS